MKSILRVALVFVVAGMSCLGLSAKDYVWTGAESTCWTNAANWADASGNPVDKCPGVARTADETTDWTALRQEADKAIFSQASTRTTIDLDGLFVISKLVFKGAETPSYVLGTGSDQTLPIRQKGSVTIESTLVNMPSFAAPILYPMGVTKNWESLTFNNLTTKELTLTGFVDGIKDPTSGLSWIGGAADICRVGRLSDLR